MSQPSFRRDHSSSDSDLLRDLRDRRGMGMIFITHDLGVIAEIADEVAVMYRGKLVEYGDVLSIYQDQNTLIPGGCSPADPSSSRS